MICQVHLLTASRKSNLIEKRSNLADNYATPVVYLPASGKLSIDAQAHARITILAAGDAVHVAGFIGDYKVRFHYRSIIKRSAYSYSYRSFLNFTERSPALHR